MINVVKNNRQKYLQEIISHLDDYSYRSKRYNIEFSLAIGLCNESIDLTTFINFKRKTDTFITLETNLCCIVLDCTAADSAIKTASNLLSVFQSKYFNKELFTAVVTSKDYDDNNNRMINDLFDILDYSVSNNMDNLVLDQSQMLEQNH